MNNIWYRTILFVLLLTMVLAPFAGFAPLLLVILIAASYWFFGSILKTLVFGESEQSKGDRDLA
ncbi:hypothetical protein IQ255_24435 [Pleurocapsales cyanobacterium LEGE 10410]|nr:hypothetical protein [Pleurocapsales cyanobacterium LEGE 10410]